MLAPCDAQIVRRDHALPGLAILLDPEALAATLSQVAPAAVPLGIPRTTYLRYKPGLACLAAYETHVKGIPVTFHAQTYAPEAHEKFEKLTGPDEIPGPLGPGHIVLREHRLVVSAFPNDRKLKTLRQLAAPASLDRLLTKLLGPDPTGWDGARVHTLAYKPERRYVGRLDVGGGGDARAVLKIYTESAYPTVRRNARAFTARGPLRVPARLGKSGWQHVLALEYLPGRVLSELLAAPDPATAAQAPLELVARALAELHARSSPTVRQRPPRPPHDGLAELADAVAWLLPDCARQARSLAESLIAHLSRIEVPANTVIHGDFYAKQVLVDAADPGRIGIVDFDEVAPGDPWSDVANFVAHLESDALRGRLPCDRVKPVTSTWCDAYQAASRRAIPSHFPLYVALSLLRLAPHPFRRRESDWPGSTRAILARVAELLGEDGRPLR
jgi:aminoglycoside phosphotransferase (APT) family kinase protein